MSSINGASPDRDPLAASADDRTTRARIRDAAIRCVAEEGIAATTARKVAAAADVSPGSVIHHFGSMDGLRQACDEHVAATIRRRKEESIAQGPGLDLVGALRAAEGEFAPLLAYLAQVLVDDSPEVAALVDDLVADAAGYMQQGIDAGMVRPTDDLDRRAAVMMIWSLGALVLHRHVHRLLGIDLAAPDSTPGEGMAAYAEPAYEILAEGIFTKDFAHTAREAFAAKRTGTHDER